jgi:polyphenol oxidase
MTTTTLMSRRSSNSSAFPSAAVQWRITDRSESWDRPWIDAARASGTDTRVCDWTWLAQPHGNDVVVVEWPGQHSGADADAAVTIARGATLVVRTADCAPVLLEGRTADGNPVLGLAHAGWKGLVSGVVEATAHAMCQLGSVSIDAWLGPCIEASCYEFGAADLQQVAAVVGPEVCALSSVGTPALDMSRGVELCCLRANVTYRGHLPGWTCTACDNTARFSHRARGDQGRMALIAFLVPQAVG